MNICVVSILIGDLPYAVAAKQNHETYCARHGYTYWCLTQSPTYARDDRVHPVWLKPDVVEQKLEEGFDYVFWMDGDSFFMNHEIGLLSLCAAAPAPDLTASGDENDLVNTGHLLFKNTEWTRSFIRQWRSFRRALMPHTLAQFRRVTTHLLYNGADIALNDQPPVNILLAGGHADDMGGWFRAFCHVNLYEGNSARVHSSADYAPTVPQNLARAHSLLDPEIAPHVAILLQSAMNSYPTTYRAGDFILHFVSHKDSFAEILVRIGKEKIDT
jgi:hypothetical protein